MELIATGTMISCELSKVAVVCEVILKNKYI
jgi:hypothetical protein